MFTIAITAHNGHRIAELGFALAAIAGGLLALGAVAPASRRGSQLSGGIALAVAGVLLVVAARWGHF